MNIHIHTYIETKNKNIMSDLPIFFPPSHFTNNAKREGSKFVIISSLTSSLTVVSTCRGTNSLMNNVMDEYTGKDV